uniref:Uncharacterized protein n=1 Tax=wastewater metagenome TaxID=527639 RepID=A0A0A8KXP5_9ZZZZ
MHSEWVLGSHIDDAMRCAHGVRACDNTFQQHMWIGLDFVPVHIGARIPFVGVADDIAIARIGKKVVAHYAPLAPCRKTCSSSASEPRLLNFFDYRFRRHGSEGLHKPRISTDSQVFAQILRIDDPTIPQHDFFLPIKESNLFPCWQKVVVVAKFDFRSPKVPVFYFCLSLFSDSCKIHIINETFCERCSFARLYIGKE